MCIHSHILEKLNFEVESPLKLNLICLILFFIINRMVNIFKHILTHVKEYCEQAAIHGPQHIVSERLSRLERLVSYRLMAEGWFPRSLFYSTVLLYILNFRLIKGSIEMSSKIDFWDIMHQSYGTTSEAKEESQKAMLGLKIINWTSWLI